MSINDTAFSAMERAAALLKNKQTVRFKPEKQVCIDKPVSV